MDDGLKIIKNVLSDARVKQNEPLRYHSPEQPETIADFFYIATNQKELVDILNLCTDLKVPFQILGSGVKLDFSKKVLTGLTIKNRASAIKLSGIKGKMRPGGLGIESALLEVDSGVSIQKLNDYLLDQNLNSVDILDALETTVGDSIKTNSSMQNMVETIKIWEHGTLDETTIADYKEEIVISVVLRVKAKE